MLAFVKLYAIIPLLIRDVSPAPSASTSPLWRGTYTQSSYWYSDYAAPKPSPKKDYLPAPQFCPETGRTVCAEVKPYYPTDDVFEVIRSAKAKRFNISSEFVDESLNDDEPIFYEEPKPQYPDTRPKHEGYVVYQTAVHYDYNNNNNPNYNNRQQNYNNPNPNHHSLGFSPQESPHSSNSYGFNNNNNNNNYNLNNNNNNNNNGNGNREQLVPSIPKQSDYPFASPFAPVRYPNDNNNNYYPLQSSQGFSQNEMISQQRQTRYKRQSGSDVDPVCPSRMILVEPKAALNDRSQWKFVVNLADKDPRLKQAIKVEVCQTPGQPCSNQVSLPFGFVSRCKQKYIKKKLLSLDSSGQSISSENFFSPSCCVCEIVRNTNKRK